MAERTIADILAECEHYWLETGVPAAAATEMRAELAGHLADATAAGKGPDAVVGDDVRAFAEAWAREQRPGPPRRVPSWDEVKTRRRHRGWISPSVVILGLLIVAVLVVAFVAGTPEEADMDTEAWRWFWTGLAVILSIGEIFSPGFFLLPFGLGAGVTAILAWAGVGGTPFHWLVFVLVSGGLLLGLRPFIRRQDEEGRKAIGANRYLDKQGIVIETIDPVAGKGLVRVDTEKWRAVTRDGSSISEGEVVTVVGVTGARLLVELRD